MKEFALVLSAADHTTCVMMISLMECVHRFVARVCMLHFTVYNSLLL